MIHPTVNLRLVAISAALVASSAAATSAAAQKQSVPKQAVAAATDKPVDAQNDVVHLLLIMKTDKNGNISKEEFNHLVNAEFDLLSKNQPGVVNVKDLVNADSHAITISFTGK